MSSQACTIHSTAVISAGAIIGEGCAIGPYSVIGPNVRLGKNNKIASHVVIEGRTTIGDSNNIFQFSSIGAIPQDLKFKGEASELHIGNENIIREFVTLQPGTEGGGMLTKIGDRNLFMANSHVGHDCIIGSGCVFANSCGIAGHVKIGNRVICGGLSGIHQFVEIGDFVMIGGGAMLTHDIPPYCVAQGDRAVLLGINKVGLDRAGVTKDDIQAIRKIYRTLFVDLYGRGTLADRCKEAASLAKDSKPAQALLTFVENSKRGVARHRSNPEGDSDAD